jgi:hypothetical protein
VLEEASPPLPPIVLYPATLIVFLLLVRVVFKTQHASGRLLLISVWLRYVMQAFHEITYQTVGGVSINALGSLGVCCIGAFILRERIAGIGRFPIILCLMAVVFASGLLNGALVPTIETLLKWGYFFVVLLAVQDCIERDGDARILGLLLWTFVPPLIYQGLSIAMGISKAGESDGSVSYIGGYNHEAAFSVVLVTCFAVASFAPKLNSALRIGLLVVSLAGIFAANYRTSLVAVAPLAFGFFVFGIARSIRPGRRLVASLIGLIAMTGGFLAAEVVLADRLKDIGAVADDHVPLLRPSEEFTVADQKVLSGRIYIWNRYLEEYRAGSDPHLLLGFGPDSWEETFGVYAHNTIISHLYEFGFIGAALVVFVWLGMLIRALRVRDWALRGQLVCAHLGFILLNMATMPFWQIEGLILYGILCGYTVCMSPSTIRRRQAILDRAASMGRSPDRWVSGRPSPRPRRVRPPETMEANE